MNRRAFTLIELLVVVAIIGILAAILFPVFARAREQARKASCSVNLKQIGLAQMMYVQDYDGKFPAYGNVDSGEPGWAERLVPYTKSLQLFQCPSEAKPQILPQAYTDYFMNSYFLGQADGASESAVGLPANTILHGENRTGKANLTCWGMHGQGSFCESGDGTNINRPLAKVC